MLSAPSPGPCLAPAGGAGGGDPILCVPRGLLDGVGLGGARGDEDSVDAALVHGLDTEVMAIHLDAVADGGQVADAAEDVAADGVVLRVLDLETKELACVLDVEQAADGGAAVRVTDDIGRRGWLELVAQGTDEALQQVLHGDDTGHAAVLVADDRHSRVVLAQAGEQLA